MTVDFRGLAAALVDAHVSRLRAGEPVTFARLLVDVDRCPSCGGQLVSGAVVSFCVDCGSRVDVEAL